MLRLLSKDYIRGSFNVLYFILGVVPHLDPACHFTRIFFIHCIFTQHTKVTCWVKVGNTPQKKYTEKAALSYLVETRIFPGQQSGVAEQRSFLNIPDVRRSYTESLEGLQSQGASHAQPPQQPHSDKRKTHHASEEV